MTIPRRNDINRNTAEELKIRACIEAIENLRAHPLLTDCSILLCQALSKLADWVDTHD